MRPLPFAATGPDDPAYMVYTSGTGGRPKGVRARPARRLGAADDVGRLVRPDPGRPRAARRRLQLDLHPRRRPDRPLGDRRHRADLRRAAGPRASGRAWPPPTARRSSPPFPAFTGRCSAAATSPRGFATLRHGLSAGEALPEAVRADWQAATGKPIYEALGMSEVSTYVSFAPGRPPVPGRAGRPQPGRRVAILPDEGDEPVPRGDRRPARGLAPRPRPDARLLAAARGDRRRLPRRVVRHRRPRAHGARTAPSPISAAPTT